MAAKVNVVVVWCAQTWEFVFRQSVGWCFNPQFDRMFCIEIICANLRDWCNFKNHMVLLEHYHLQEYGHSMLLKVKYASSYLLVGRCLIQKMTQWSCRAVRIHLDLQWKTSSLVFFNHELLLMAEILHQLRLVVYPIIYRVLHIPGGAVAQAFFQYHQFPKWICQGPKARIGRCWVEHRHLSHADFVIHHWTSICHVL